MSEKLLKQKCYVLVRSQNGNERPIINIIGVFKNKKHGERYLKWLKPKDVENYHIHPSKRFIYVDAWQGMLKKEEEDAE